MTAADTLRAQSLAALMTEADLQTSVIDLARFYGALIHHTRPALRQSGRYSTPIQGDRGYPDLTIALPGALLIAELKSERGTRTKEQIRWAAALQPYYRLWRPADWYSGEIRHALEAASEPVHLPDTGGES